MKYFGIGVIIFIFTTISSAVIADLLGKSSNDLQVIFNALTILSAIIVACTALIVDTIKKSLNRTFCRKYSN